MKKINQIVMAVVMSGLMAMSVWADGKGKDLTLLHDISVNGTVVKQGNYQVTFDKEKNELELWKGKSLVAKTPAHLENLKNRANDNLVKLTNQGNTNILRSVTIAGENEKIVVNDGETIAVTPQ